MLNPYKYRNLQKKEAVEYRERNANNWKNPCAHQRIWSSSQLWWFLHVMCWYRSRMGTAERDDFTQGGPTYSNYPVPVTSHKTVSNLLFGCGPLASMPARQMNKTYPKSKFLNQTASCQFFLGRRTVDCDLSFSLARYMWAMILQSMPQGSQQTLLLTMWSWCFSWISWIKCFLLENAWEDDPQTNSDTKTPVHIYTLPNHNHASVETRAKWKRRKKSPKMAIFPWSMIVGNKVMDI